MAKPVKPAGTRRPAPTPAVPAKGFAKVDAIAEQAVVEAAEEPAPAPAAVVTTPVVETPAPPVEATVPPIETVTDTVSAPVQQAAEAVETATASVAPTVSKDVTLMATAFEAPKAFGDINDRAKGALEKGGKFVAEFGEFAKGNVEAVVESTRITAKGFESLGQDAADFTRKSFEGATANLRNLASVKSPTELFKLHSDYVRSAFDDLVAQQSKSTEAFIKLAGDAAQPLSNRFALAAEKVKTIA